MKLHELKAIRLESGQDWLSYRFIFKLVVSSSSDGWYVGIREPLHNVTHTLYESTSKKLVLAYYARSVKEMVDNGYFRVIEDKDRDAELSTAFVYNGRTLYREDRHEDSVPKRD